MSTDELAREKAISRANLLQIVALTRDKRSLEEEVQRLRGDIHDSPSNPPIVAEASASREREELRAALEERLEKAENDFRIRDAEAQAFGATEQASKEKIEMLEEQLRNATDALDASQKEAAAFAKQAQAALDDVASDAAQDAADAATLAAEARGARALEDAKAAHAAELERVHAAHASERDELARSLAATEQKRTESDIAAGLACAAARTSSEDGNRDAELLAERDHAKDRLEELRHELEMTKAALDASQREVASMAKAATAAAASSEEVEEAEARGARALEDALRDHAAELAKLRAAHSADIDAASAAQQRAKDAHTGAEAAAQVARAESAANVREVGGLVPMQDGPPSIVP